VLNKQGPNQQIWWSSPISGPLRFDFDGASGEWVSSRTKLPLIPLLKEEMSEVLGIPMHWE
jgi:frataxin